MYLMFYLLYEYLFQRKLEESLFPKEICFMLSETDLFAEPGQVEAVCRWCMDFPAIERIIFHISSQYPKSLAEKILPLRNFSYAATVRLSTAFNEETYGSGKPEILLVIGRSGREEISGAIATIATEGIDPAAITEETIESHLRYQVNPDFVIKTGGSHLTDFLIWQSVYSELFFTDVNWRRFRRLDLLRALRDYQSRVRRYGQ